MDGSFVTDKTNVYKWAWKDKLGEWGRYVLPIMSKREESDRQISGGEHSRGQDDRAGGPPLQKLPLPLTPTVTRPEGGDEYRLKVPPISHAVEWSKTIETSTKAYFGHLLHAQQPSPPPSALPDLVAASPPRIFSPVTPHPLHLASLEEPRRGEVSAHIVRPRSTIVIKFWPSPPSSETSTPEPPPPYISPAVNTELAEQRRQAALMKKKKKGTGKKTMHDIEKEWAAQQAQKERGEEDAEEAAAEEEEELAAPDSDADAYADAVFDPAQSAPALELRLAATDTEVLGVESLRAILRTRVSDVMLPSSVVDVRFAQTQQVSLGPVPISPLADDSNNPIPTPSHDNTTTTSDNNNDAVGYGHAEALSNWQPISDFLSRARLDLAHGKLEVPHHQKFPVPWRLFNHHNQSNTDTKEEQGAQEQEQEPPLGNEDDLRNTSYAFVGLEMHRSASMPYVDGGHQPLRLTYTSVEAGQGGGRRAEVTLEPVVDAEQVQVQVRGGDAGAAGVGPEGGEGGGGGGQEQETELEQDFLASCYRLARMHGLWTGQLASRRRDPEEDI